MHNLPRGRERGSPEHRRSPRGQAHPAHGRHWLPRPGDPRTAPARLPETPARPCWCARSSPRRPSTAVHYLTRKPSFDVLRERLGGDDALLATLDDQVDVIDGRLHARRARHPRRDRRRDPLGRHGQLRPADRRGLPDEPARRPEPLPRARPHNNTPHLVHVSTAYVAGVQKGVIPEGPLDHKVDYALEAADGAAGPRRGRVGQPQARDARALHGQGREGPLPRRPQHGQHRRRGAPQALGGQAPDRVRADARAHARLARRLHLHEGDGGARGRGPRARARACSLSIVRPSIIESALEHPSPGWIDGFKMADPIIRAYGMGQIPEFPGIPEGIVDLIPVDYVVNAILAVAATPPPAGRARPLQRVERRPEPAALLRALRVRPRVLRGAPVARARPRRAQGARPGTSPATSKVEKMLRRAETARPTWREKVVTHLPKSKTMRDAVNARRPRQGARRLHRALLRPVRHVHRDRGRLHGRARASAVGQPVRRRTGQRFPFDAGVLDWKYYLQDVHCPAVTQSLRELSREGSREADGHRSARATTRCSRSSTWRARSSRSNVVESYVWTRFADLPTRGVAGRAGQRVRPDPRLPADRPSRPRRLPADVLPAVRGRERRGRRRAGRGTTWPSSCCRRRRPAAIRRVREHRAAGHRTVMITAAAEPFVRVLGAAVRRR